MIKSREEYREHRLGKLDISKKHECPDLINCVAHDLDFVRKLWPKNVYDMSKGKFIAPHGELKKSILYQDIMEERKQIKTKHGKKTNTNHIV